MKSFKSLAVISFVVLISLLGCSNDDSADNSSRIPMTAKINGEFFELFNPFGTDEATSSFNTNYPNDQFILLQGRNFNSNNGGIVEINVWINRNDLKTGTYNVGVDTDDVTTHIDLIDLRNFEGENTISGNITITNIDITNKTIEGTFEFNSADGSDINATINSVVTEGNFNYKYDTF